MRCKKCGKECTAEPVKLINGHGYKAGSNCCGKDIDYDEFQVIKGEKGDKFTNHTHGLTGFSGISLRDYFAAKAMINLINLFPQTQMSIIAKLAYEQSDAMLAEREK